MPKANKHIEVKPSKYKTSLCQFYTRGEACPFGSRCAFAHGEEELQSEERNIEILKSTGLQRLDGVPEPLSITDSEINALAASTVQPPISSPLLRRRPVMISLPKFNTASENYQSPYSFGQTQAGTYSDFIQVDVNMSMEVNSHYFDNCYSAPRHCRNTLSSTCRNEHPLTYRHNPYNLSARFY